MRADRLRLLDAIEQIALIVSFSQQGREAFFGDVMVQSANCIGWRSLARPAAEYPLKICRAQ